MRSRGRWFAGIGHVNSWPAEKELAQDAVEEKMRFGDQLSNFPIRLRGPWKMLLCPMPFVSGSVYVCGKTYFRFEKDILYFNNGGAEPFTWLEWKLWTYSKIVASLVWRNSKLWSFTVTLHFFSIYLPQWFMVKWLSKWRKMLNFPQRSHNGSISLTCESVASNWRKFD